MAERLAGKTVAMDIHEPRLGELEEEVAEMGLSDNMRILKGDITVEEDCAAAIKLCVDTFGTKTGIA